MVDSVIINEKFNVGLSMGPMFNTTVKPLLGGYEDRNQDWPLALWRYDAEFINRPRSEIEAFITFLLGRRGAARTFLLKDPLYYTLTDENIGTGDGTTASFQAHQLFNDSANPYYRNWYTIQSLVVKVAGVTKTVTVHYTETDGLITFTGGNIPTAGQAITISGDPKVRVRFAEDWNPIKIPHGTWTDAPMSAGPFTLMEVPE